LPLFFDLSGDCPVILQAQNEGLVDMPHTFGGGRWSLGRSSPWRSDRSKLWEPASGEGDRGTKSKCFEESGE